MSRAGLLCLVLVALTAPPVTAAEDVPGFKSGNDLLRVCTSQKLIEFGMCAGYLEGTADQLEAARNENNLPRCLPKKVAVQQLKEVVVKLLQENPASRNHAAAQLTTIAIMGAWRCAD